MSIHIIVDDPNDWNFEHPGIKTISAKDYLEISEYTNDRKLRVFNLCYSYKYQSFGYYVSLIAAARGQYHLPSVNTIQDTSIKILPLYQHTELSNLLNKLSDKLAGTQFQLLICFGKSTDHHLNKLSRFLFNLFPAPFLKARFSRNSASSPWVLQELKLASINDVAPEHYETIYEQIIDYLVLRNPKRSRRLKSQNFRYELAILNSHDDPTPPSDPVAIERFRDAASDLKIDTVIINKRDYASLPRFDALFIRDTTHVDHYTYKFAKRAESCGQVVIDDPTSILRCCNKVFLHELFQNRKIPSPRSIMISRKTVSQIKALIGFPCVVKLPDSAFSSGVFKFHTEEELKAAIPKLFRKSDLLLVQEFIPSSYDWRVGIIDGEPLYVCKYFMANNHWQIIHHQENGQSQSGDFQTIPLGEAPWAIVTTAVKAANLIGRGLYGVDLKLINGRPVVIEVNDNPSIESDVEDHFLKDKLYTKIMETFLKRLDSRFQTRK